MISDSSISNSNVSREQFADWVRSALRQLYDSPSLQMHPLVEALGCAEEGMLDTAQALRRRLLEAIQAQRPKDSVPAASHDWRAFRILELRYLEGLSPNEAMEALALQKSQFYRDQAAALQRVCDFMWCNCAAAPSETDADEAHASANPETLLGSEMERLSAGVTWEQIDLGSLLEELQEVWVPLAQAKGKLVQLDTTASVQVRRGSRVLLRQAILNLVTCALDVNPSEPVRIQTFSGASRAGVWVRAGRVPPSSAQTERGTAAASHTRDARLEVCRRLAGAMHAAFQGRAVEGAHWEAQLIWHVVAGRRLLVIDDNTGFEELFRRYLTGHGWQVIGAAAGAEARGMVAGARPTAITLDVLMPQEDGWELLIALKSNADTRDIPVIVCSILHEPQLAFSLGAAAYLPKPVSEEALLRVLMPWTEPSASAGRARSD
ncbi:MAG: response regulator [Anaerolineae bacterium]|nr:response regulator [Anaerolineae bacterium]